MAYLNYEKKTVNGGLVVFARFEGATELNLIDQKSTLKYLKKIKPQFVIIAAARVGGILANQNFKANFIYENLMIQTNLIHASFKVGVKKLIFLAYQMYGRI